MTDLPYVHARAATPTRRAAWPLILYVAVGAAGVAGFVAGQQLAGPDVAGNQAAGMEWQLALLLRFMAVVKGAMALGALALAQWRLRRPISTPLAAGYAVSLVAMALAPGLIWSLAEIVPGAAAFHLGLFLYLGLAWRDGAVALPQSLSKPSSRRGRG